MVEPSSGEKNEIAKAAIKINGPMFLVLFKAVGIRSAENIRILQTPGAKYRE
jgi:hypothetical protein